MRVFFLSLLLDIAKEKKLWERVAWKELCQNPWVRWEDLISIMDKVPFIKKYLYLHPQFPPEEILGWFSACPTPPDYWTHLSKTMPMSFIVMTLDDGRYRWVFRSLCQNPDMTPAVLQEHFWPYFSHDVRRAVLRDSCLYEHPRFLPQDLVFENRVLNVFALSHHPSFGTSWLSILPRKRWKELDWNHLSAKIDPAFIQTTWGQYPWTLEGLSHHPRMPFSMVLRHRRSKKLDWEAISLHVRLSDLCLYHHRLPFRYQTVSRNLHLRPWFVREHPMKKWDRIQLAMNPAMVPQEIWEDRLLFPVWRWDHVLRNPSLDKETLDKMNVSFLKRLVLVKNHFSLDPRYRELQVIRIQGFFASVQKRREITRKVRFLRGVYRMLNADVWGYLVRFI